MFVVVILFCLLWRFLSFVVDLLMVVVLIFFLPFNNVTVKCLCVCFVFSKFI